jgi:hypothetical protein
MILVCQGWPGLLDKRDLVRMSTQRGAGEDTPAQRLMLAASAFLLAAAAFVAFAFVAAVDRGLHRAIQCEFAKLS